MENRDPSERPGNSRDDSRAVDRWVLTVVAAVFLGLVGADFLDGFEVRKIAGILVLVMWVPMLVVHEAGHALVARCCGWRVDRVVIGVGKSLWRFKVAGIPVTVNRVPLSGYVLPRPLDLRHPRLKNTLVYAGGPGIEIAVLAVVAVAVGPQRLFALSDSIPIIAAQSLCVTIAMGLVFTLVPHTTRSGGGNSWSDGLGILMSWRLPDAYFRNWIEADAPPESDDEPFPEI